MTHDPNAHSLGFAEELFEAYLNDASSVPPDWREYFERIVSRDGDSTRWRPAPSMKVRSVFNPSGVNGRRAGTPSEQTSKVAALQQKVDQFVRNYRVRGHRIARLDPLGMPQPVPPELDPAYNGFTDSDMDLRFTTDAIRGVSSWTLREIHERLRNTYCRHIGAQFMHIDDLAIRQWLQDRMEGTENRIELSRREQITILARLTDAVIFEEFIQKKWIGAKSFSLEGAETLIPLLHLAIEKAGSQSIDEIVIGMAHRGRLNVLANIVGKGAREIFREFEDIDPRAHRGSGDVKYHLGYNSDWRTRAGETIHLSLCFNPSHLEFVNPVAVGRVRAKQDRAGDRKRRHKMAILIHGDASFIGEGVVQETLNVSQLAGYRTGGTLHVIVNNQIGFTTGPDETRSSTYASDIAKMLQIPIFHVNGEDPESVAAVVRLAMDFREEFQRDVIIDMYCYRRRGHNEGDEPSFTQPLLYRAISERKSVRQGYLDHLLKLEGVTREEADRLAEHRREHLEKEFSAAHGREYVAPPVSLGGIWEGYLGGLERHVDDVETVVEKETLSRILKRITTVPDHFNINRKVERGLAQRREMASGVRPLDWTAGEALAFGSLALEGIPIRLTGQDSERGTFSQRHASWRDVETGEPYCPLQFMSEKQAPVEIRNSSLSEAGVLGFEYGYSLDRPDGLTLWEAQFGDFANAAQVIIDQFIVSAEDKWRRLSGIVLLLPHGFEGQGPEHSSARLERFLMLAAEDNIQIVYPTTPAQYFHVLRRQAIRRWRKPLIVMTPKSLLRHQQAVSSLDDLSNGRFQRVIPDREAPKAGNVERILICSGKIYYELLERRKELSRQDVAIIRIEQLYPFPTEELQAALASFNDRTQVIWVQEEPENMGAWRFLRVRYGDCLFGRLNFTGVMRPASASPATGSKASHKIEQEQLLARAFGGTGERMEACSPDVES